MTTDAHATADQVATRMSELADAVAQALPASVLERLCTDLDREPETSAALVLELARARRRLSGAEVHPGHVVGDQVPGAAGEPANDVASHQTALAQTALPDLAARLSALSIEFDGDGNRNGALAAGMQSVRLYCALARSRPGAYLAGLAASLNNIGVDFLHLGRADEACIAIEQSVAIRRVLAGRQPEIHLQELAVSLNNYGGCLSRLERPGDAFAASREAAEIRLWLAERSPEKFMPALASTLVNLAGNLTRLDRHREAEAVKALTMEICSRIEMSHQRAYRANGPKVLDLLETTD